MSDQKEVLIRKLLKNCLNRNEQKALLDQEPLHSAMCEQFDNAPSFTKQDHVSGTEIFDKIIQSTYPKKKRSRGSLLWPLYGVAVSCMLLLIVGKQLFFEINENFGQTRYVVTTGIQRIEEVTLPDGSVVKLGPGSRLEYPGRFAGFKREIKLDGQAFVTVAKDENKPFVVATNRMDVTALGTAFEVFNYDHNNEFETILLNGKVRIQMKDSLSNIQKPFELNPNQKFSYEKNAHHGAITIVNADHYTAWRNKFNPSFVNESLAVIAPRLEEWYGVQINYPAEIANKYRYTFTIRDESLDRILDMFKRTSPISFTRKEYQYSLYDETVNR